MLYECIHDLESGGLIRVKCRNWISILLPTTCTLFTKALHAIQSRL